MCAEKCLQRCSGRDRSFHWMEYSSSLPPECDHNLHLDLAYYLNILVFDPSYHVLGPPGCRLPDWPRSNVARVSILSISGYYIQPITLRVPMSPVSFLPTSSPSSASTVYLMLLHFYLFSNFQVFPTVLVSESFLLCCSNMVWGLIFYFKHIWQ